MDELLCNRIPGHFSAVRSTLRSVFRTLPSSGSGRLQISWKSHALNFPPGSRQTLGILPWKHGLCVLLVFFTPRTSFTSIISPIYDLNTGWHWSTFPFPSLHCSPTKQLSVILFRAWNNDLCNVDNTLCRFCLVVGAINSSEASKLSDKSEEV